MTNLTRRSPNCAIEPQRHLEDHGKVPRHSRLISSQPGVLEKFRNILKTFVTKDAGAYQRDVSKSETLEIFKTLTVANVCKGGSTSKTQDDTNPCTNNATEKICNLCQDVVKELEDRDWTLGEICCIFTSWKCKSGGLQNNAGIDCLESGTNNCAVLTTDGINDSWEAMSRLRFVTLEELCTLFCENDSTGDICKICEGMPGEDKKWTLGASDSNQNSICCNNKYWGCLIEKCVEDCPKKCRDQARNNWGYYIG